MSESLIEEAGKRYFSIGKDLKANVLEPYGL
jgi:hypothetical protein